MNVVYVLLTFLAGMCSPLQAGINAQLRLWTRDPVLAALISFAVGTLALFFYSLAFRTPWPPLGTAGNQPWWIWVGGFLGAFLVAVTVATAPKLGAAALIGFLIAGQMVSGQILDHFGLVGYHERPLTVLRVIGGAMVLGGAILIHKY
jgi:transporter family-2 protein